MIGWIVVVVILAIAAYAVVMYNNLVSNRQLTQEGWSGIDVQLKRRADLIPNLLETVKGYMSHERETLEAVTNARAAATAGATGSPEQRAQLEGALSGALGRLMAVAEAYPDLKANTTFLEFQAALQKIEDELQLARRYYNGTARNLNVAVQSFPSSIIASMFHFTTAQYFELDNPADRAVPTVKFS
ncbi:MAG: LemA family protein [Devosia sp.]|jgi:LemA protein|nr:LemA family protein [Devosiaceae bacterium]